jgi:hypothetical protein
MFSHMDFSANIKQGLIFYFIFPTCSDRMFITHILGQLPFNSTVVDDVFLLFHMLRNGKDIFPPGIFT